MAIKALVKVDSRAQAVKEPQITMVHKPVTTRATITRMATMQAQFTPLQMKLVPVPRQIQPTSRVQAQQTATITRYRKLVKPMRLVL